MPWPQNYDPFGNAWISTFVAALPVATLLGSIAFLKIRVHYAALLGLAVALAVALFGFKMPFLAAIAAAGFGAGYGLFPIGWIILNLIFLHQLTVEKGMFAVLRSSLGSFAPDPRIQLILVAFSFGAFFEGAAGFGTPVAVTAAILMQLRFSPLQAAGLSLIANTAPVAFGALGTPIIALASVTGLDLHALSAMVGRQLPFFSLLIPFWVVWAYAGFRGMLGVWPAALTAGLSFAVPQFLVSNFHGPWLVDVVAAICSMAAVGLLLKVWRPAELWPVDGLNHREEMPGANTLPRGKARPEFKESATLPVSAPEAAHSRAVVARAWLPWLLLSLFVFVWGLPAAKDFMNGLSSPKFPVKFLHQAVVRAPPAVPAPTAEKPTKAEGAEFTLNWLSATGTGILAAAVVAGLIMGFSMGDLLRVYGETVYRLRFSLYTIATMLAIGYVTRYSGTDVTLGLAMAKTGRLYPLCGTLLGWLGVALTGSDSASNILFGGLQRITSEQLGIHPTLMAAANSSGGVMGKMVDAQSIVVAGAATHWHGHEGKILRFVFFHSVALAFLVGLLVLAQADLFPSMIPGR